MVVVVVENEERRMKGGRLKDKKGSGKRSLRVREKATHGRGIGQIFSDVKQFDPSDKSETN
eukprot:579747-Hanusia_phi.AAC.1